MSGDQRTKLEEASRKVAEEIARNKTVQQQIQQDVLGKTLQIDKVIKGLRF